MIQVDEALAIVMANSSKMKVQQVALLKALGAVLSQTIYSPAIPLFRKSACDGYAFMRSERHQYDITSGLQTAENANLKLKENEALQVVKGAFIPHNADTVVPEDDVMANEKSILIMNMPVQFANIHNHAEHTKKAEVVLEANTLITAATIGFLASLGVKEVSVFKKPKVVILWAGNESLKSEKKSQIENNDKDNSLMLQALLQKNGIRKAKIFKVKANLKSMKKAVKLCCEKYDIVLISGSEEDFVEEALLENEVKVLFSNINQAPGKSITFGSKSESLIFALPSNPVSLLTNFYVYVYPAIKNLMGFSDIHLSKGYRKLDASVANTSGKTQFLKALYNETHVTVLEDQSSETLGTLLSANCLVIVSHEQESLSKEQIVSILPMN